jgi:hypothetical protein
MTNGKDDNNDDELIIIDTVKVEEITMNNICFYIGESKYPQVKIQNNIVFEKQVNDLLLLNFYNLIDTAKSQFAGCWEDDEEDPNSINLSKKFPAGATCDFETLQNKDDIVSIVQTCFYHPCGGGTRTFENANTLTFDVNDLIIFGNQDYGINYEDKEELISKIKAYFILNYDFEEYPKIVDLKGFEKINFGIRNDSLMLILEARPWAMSYNSIFIIPYDKWERQIHE